MRKAITAFTLLISCFCGVFAQEFSDSAELHFRQGKSTLELDYKNNRGEMDSLLRQLRAISYSPSTMRRNIKRYSCDWRCFA